MSQRGSWAVLVLAAPLAAISVAASAAPGDDLVAQSRKQLEAGDATAALATATRAITVAPNNYQGHYYVSMAKLALEDFAAATSAAEKAAALAPAAARPAVNRLLDTIRARAPAPSVMLYLRCTGELTRDHLDARRFDAIYRIDLTGQTLSRWEKTGWVSMHCSDPGPGTKGEYIEYRDQARCEFNDTKFYRSYTFDNVSSTGDKVDALSTWTIDRRTGTLETWAQFKRWNPATESEPRRPIERVQASCERTEPPQPPAPTPTKF